MEVQELYETLTKLMKEGKGDYIVGIRFEGTGDEDRAYGVDIEDGHKEIVIKAV